MAKKISRSLRRVKVKTPGGKINIQYRNRATSTAKCIKCSGILHGVKHSRGLAASKRNPSRPYAGILCSRCMRATIKSLNK